MNRECTAWLVGAFRVLSHFVAGLAIGLMFYAAFALVVAMNTHGKADVPTSMNYDLCALVIPIAFSIWGGTKSSSSPLPWLSHPAVFALNLLVVVGAGLCDMFIVFLTSMAGFSFC